MSRRGVRAIYRSISLHLSRKTELSMPVRQGRADLIIKKPAKAIRPPRQSISRQGLRPDGHGTEERRLILNDGFKNDQRSE